MTIEELRAKIEAESHATFDIIRHGVLIADSSEDTHLRGLLAGLDWVLDVIDGEISGDPPEPPNE